ncbi:AAA domain containing protein [uncultured Caudovirales phage]|uniref:AAA domain containing protein n=1 Tax=uncultured Caudovirales phage TaxID=2100421 RepID=A0A6J7XBZ7_9CAUD|nr:AAA domain containing protein [uncultured Caudovirales phage]
MRIAISGSACQGKSTLIDDMIKTWPMYKRSAESYRKVIHDENIPLNEKTTKDGQWRILNCLIDDIQKTSKDDNILFDRCALDNIVYSLWSNSKNATDIDDEFIKKCIPLVQETMHSLDIIFFTPITKFSPIPVEERKTRNINEEYIKEIDNIFKAISYGYAKTGASPFFPKEDRPPIIEVFGDREQRIAMMQLYIDTTGDIVSDEKSVLSNENIDLVEKLINDQKDVQQAEAQEEKFRSSIIRAKNIEGFN